MKRRLVIAGGAILALAMSFVGGRFSRPARVVETVKTQEVVKWQNKVVIEKVATENVSRATDVVTKWRTVYKPGGIVIKTVSKETSSRAAKFNTAKSVEKSATVATSETSTSTSRTALAQSRPNWSLSAIGLLEKSDVLDLHFRPGLGVVVSRRVLGPLHVGAFGSTRGEAGLVIGASW